MMMGRCMLPWGMPAVATKVTMTVIMSVAVATTMVVVIVKVIVMFYHNFGPKLGVVHNCSFFGHDVKQGLQNEIFAIGQDTGARYGKQFSGIILLN